MINKIKHIIKSISLNNIILKNIRYTKTSISNHNCNIISLVGSELSRSIFPRFPFHDARRSFPFGRSDRFLSIDPWFSMTIHAIQHAALSAMIPMVNWNPHCRLICDSLFTLSARGYDTMVYAVFELMDLWWFDSIHD